MQSQKPTHIFSFPALISGASRLFHPATAQAHAPRWKIKKRNIFFNPALISGASRLFHPATAQANAPQFFRQKRKKKILVTLRSAVTAACASPGAQSLGVGCVALMRHISERVTFRASQFRIFLNFT